MSTKTSFKRIALVAVAALGFGMLSVVPSNATQLVSITQATAPTSGVTDTEVRSIVSLNGICDTTGQYGATNYLAVWTSIPATSRVGVPTFGALTTAETTLHSSASTNYSPTSSGLAFSGQYQNVGYYWDAVGNAKSAKPNNAYILCNNTGRYAQLAALSFTPDTGGTYTMMIFDPTNTSTQIFWTVTVAGGIYSSSKTYVYTGETTTATAVNATSTDVYNVDGITEVATASTDAVATFKVQQRDVNGVELTAGSKAITASTTIGSISTSATSSSSSYVAIGSAAATGVNVGSQLFYLFPDGRTGKAVVTLSVDGAVVGTYSVTFYGTTIASLSMVPYKPVIATSIGTSTGGEATATDNTGNYTKSSWQFILVAKDANGNEIVGGDLGTTEASPKLTISSSNPAVATAAVIDDSYDSTYGGWKVTGSAGVAGTTTITVADKATGLIKATGVITVASTTIASIALATDATDYKPGDKVTVTLTAKDASGNAIADGVYFNLLKGAVVSTQTINAYPFDAVRTTGAYVGTGLGYDAGDVSFTGGVAKATFYAPASTFKLTASLSATNARLAYALQGTDLTATATVTNESTVAAQAATDAASEAVDAANAATDAANAAAEAADAATAAAQDAADAVAALSTSVTAMVDALKKQITALTNLVIKIQKKVKA